MFWEVTAIETAMQNLSDFFSDASVNSGVSVFIQYLVYFSRFMLAVAAIAVLSRCIRSMFRERYEPEVWGFVDMPNGSRVPLRSWEITIGRSKSSDIAINGKDTQATHLVLIRSETGVWTVHDITDGTNASVNGEIIPPEGFILEDGDVIDLGGAELHFVNLTEEERRIIASRRTAPGRNISPGAMFTYVTVFQIILMFQHVYYAAAENRLQLAMAFAVLIVVMWLYFLIMRSMGRKGFEVEALAFFLCSIGLSVCASSSPDSLVKQLIIIVMGVLLFVLLGWWLRDLKRVKKMRIPAAVLAVALLAVNIVIGKSFGMGSNNWLSVAGFSIQPSEFVKVIFIYAGAATMDKLYRRRNLFVFVAFSAICVGALALIGDFGTAIVFFATFLVISFLRSGSIATVVLSITGAGLAGIIALTIKPYIAQRFANWGHIWEDVNGAGWQQTRTLSAAASGGMFGQGAGNGWLHEITASDTDMVFGMVSEELGLIVAVCAMAAIVILAVFVVRNAAQSRSAFYVIAGVASVSLMMVQMGLNVFGSLDILPFTGVTFPFVSMGGSSLLSCWALLAFIKATDTRRDASFVVKNPEKLRDNNEFNVVPEPPEDDYGEPEEPQRRDIFDRRDERRRGK